MATVAHGVREPVLVPRWIAVAAATGIEVGGRLGRRPPLVCRESLRTVMHGHRYDGSRAERELGLRYRPIDETLRRTVAWLREEHLVPEASACSKSAKSLVQVMDESAENRAQ